MRHLIKPSLAYGPQTADDASVTSFTQRSTACEWHGNLKILISSCIFLIICFNCSDENCLAIGGSITSISCQFINSV